jgi:hypothetical protein
MMAPLSLARRGRSSGSSQIFPERTPVVMLLDARGADRRVSWVKLTRRA